MLLNRRSTNDRGISTVTATRPLTPPIVALIVATPADSAVTMPAPGSTTTTLGSLELHETGTLGNTAPFASRVIAARVRDSSIASVSGPGPTSIDPGATVSTSIEDAPPRRAVIDTV